MIRVFIGAAPNHDDAESQMVLEYTLRKYASEPVEITWLMLSRDPTSPFYGWDTSAWATPFSGFRYAVPALCGFKGRGIYMDSDVIERADIAELWNRPIHPACDVVARSASRLCVSLWDCERAGVRGMTLEAAKRGERTPLAIEHFHDSENWNCLDGEKFALDDPRVKAIHYTSMPHQPHLPLAINRLKAAGRRHWFDGVPTPHWRRDVIDLFALEYHNALLAGYTIEQYCRHEPYGHVSKGSNSGLRGAVPAWGK